MHKNLYTQTSAVEEKAIASMWPSQSAALYVKLYQKVKGIVKSADGAAAAAAQPYVLKTA